VVKNQFKGARSCNFRQFQHWSSGHRINWNNKITAQNCRRTQTKHRKAKKGQGWTKLGRIEMDYIWINLKNVGPPFFKFISVYMKMSFKQLENHSQLLCGPWFWKWEILALPIWRLELITKQNKTKLPETVWPIAPLTKQVWQILGNYCYSLVANQCMWAVSFLKRTNYYY